MKRIFLSFVMLLAGCSSTASDDQDAKDATESFYKSYLSAFGSDDARPIQPAHRRVFYTFHSSFSCRCKP